VTTWELFWVMYAVVGGGTFIAIWIGHWVHFRRTPVLVGHVVSSVFAAALWPFLYGLILSRKAGRNP
jgi:hypothetical protein